MASLPDSAVDVFYGDPAKPLPDWRMHAHDDEPDDDDELTGDELTGDERAALVGVLGFDPAELAEGGEGGQPDTFPGPGHVQ